MKRVLLILLFNCLFSINANAALCSLGGGAGDDCFWIGAVNSTWATNGNWSNTAGGVSCACQPASGANIFLTNSANISIGGARTVGDFDATGYTGTITWGSNTVSSNKANAVLKFVSGMGNIASLGASSILETTATSGTTTLDSGGKTMPQIRVNGAGGKIQLNSNALTIDNTTGGLVVTNGDFDTNNLDVTTPVLTTGNNANTKVITLGTSNITITALINASYDMRGASTTLSASSATIKFIPNAAGEGTLNFTTATIGTVQFNPTAVSTYTRYIPSNAAPTFTNMTVGAGTVLTFGVGITITNAPTLTGTSAKPINLLSSSAVRTITSSGGLTCDWCIIGWITKSGGTFTATNSFDIGSNTGWSITGPSIGSGSAIFGSGI